MSEPELQLDPAIRIWVFLPIVMITFLIGVLRHYVSVLLSSQKKVDLSQVTDSQALIRARMLRENGKYLPKQSFLMRKHYFNNEETGVLKAGSKRQSAPPNPMTDPSMMTEMLKGNLTSMVPMVVVGGVRGAAQLDSQAAPPSSSSSSSSLLLRAPPPPNSSGLARQPLRAGQAAEKAAWWSGSRLPISSCLDLNLVSRTNSLYRVSAD